MSLPSRLRAPTSAPRSHFRCGGFRPASFAAFYLRFILVKWISHFLASILHLSRLLYVLRVATRVRAPISAPPPLGAAHRHALPGTITKRE